MTWKAGFWVNIFSLCVPACSVVSDSFAAPGCSLPGSSVHGISQASILGWVAISSSKGSSQPRVQTWVPCVFCTGRWILYHWATWESPFFSLYGVVNDPHKVKIIIKFYQIASLVNKPQSRQHLDRIVLCLVQYMMWLTRVRWRCIRPELFFFFPYKALNSTFFVKDQKRLWRP